MSITRAIIPRIFPLLITKAKTAHSKHEDSPYAVSKTIPQASPIFTYPLPDRTLEAFTGMFLAFLPRPYFQPATPSLKCRNRPSLQYGLWAVEVAAIFRWFLAGERASLNAGSWVYFSF